MWSMAVLALVALLASGCGRCTGCLDSVAVDLPANALTKGTPYTFRICFDSTCANGLLSPIPSGAICTTDEWLCSADVGSASRVTILLTDTRLLASGQRQVSFELSSGGAVVAKKSATVAFPDLPPTDSCPPICRRGTL